MHAALGHEMWELRVSIALSDGVQVYMGRVRLLNLPSRSIQFLISWPFGGYPFSDFFFFNSTFYCIYLFFSPSSCLAVRLSSSLPETSSPRSLRGLNPSSSPPVVINSTGERERTGSRVTFPASRRSWPSFHRRYLLKGRCEGDRAHNLILLRRCRRVAKYTYCIVHQLAFFNCSPASETT